MKWEAQTVLNTIHRKIQTLCIWLNLLPKPHSTVSNKEMGNTNESLIYPPLNFLHITRSVFVSMGITAAYYITIVYILLNGETINFLPM